jgi:tetratricopeptide (TPR) repeat protein
LTGARFCVLGFLALVAAAVAGCATGRGASGDSAALETATATYLAGEYDEAAKAYTDFLASDPSTALQAEAYLGRANAYYRLARYDLSEADFRSAERITRDRTVKAQATLGIAHSLFARERYGEAERLYLRVLSAFKGFVPRDETTYRLGMTLSRQAKWADGQHYLEDVVLNWPSGEFARLAKAKLPSVRDRTFSVQIGAFTSKALAESEAGKLKAEGLPGEVVSIDMDGVTGFAVRSGRFATWAAAGDHAEILERAGFSTYRVP